MVIGDDGIGGDDEDGDDEDGDDEDGDDEDGGDEDGGDDGDVKVQTSPKVWCNERFLSQEDGEVLYSSSERDSLWNGRLAPRS